jgi:hypothetical protein
MALVVAACGGASPPSVSVPAASAKPATGGLVKVRYGELRILGDAGIYIALEQASSPSRGSSWTWCRSIPR